MGAVEGIWEWATCLCKVCVYISRAHKAADLLSGRLGGGQPGEVGTPEMEWNFEGMLGTARDSVYVLIMADLGIGKRGRDKGTADFAGNKVGRRPCWSNMNVCECKLRHMTR